MANHDAAERFMKDIEALIETNSSGKMRVDLDGLRTRVASDGELSIAMAQAYARSVGTSRGYGQMALGIAHAYHDAFGDDSLLLDIQRELRDKGYGDIEYDPVLNNGDPMPSQPELLLVDISGDEMRRLDIFPLQRAFAATGAGREDPQYRRSMRGRLALGFPLENDPREVWMIPEARAYIARVFEAMPYFPYYLHPEPQIGAPRMFFACLAPPEAFVEGNVNIGHERVIETIISAIDAAVAVAPQLGDTPDGVREQILSLFPKDFRDMLADELQG